jgi:hypothetical protein
MTNCCWVASISQKNRNIGRFCQVTMINWTIYTKPVTMINWTIYAQALDSNHFVKWRAHRLSLL